MTVTSRSKFFFVDYARRKLVEITRFAAVAVPVAPSALTKSKLAKNDVAIFMMVTSFLSFALTRLMASSVPVRVAIKKDL